MGEIFKYVDNPKFINGNRVVNDIFLAKECLKNGETIARFEYGDSMLPILKSGEYCIVQPIKNINDVNIGDVVFCNVNGYLMTHMVLLKSNGGHDKPNFLIGSTEMYSYGWTDEIYGICKGTNIIEKPLTYEEIEEL